MNFERLKNFLGVLAKSSETQFPEVFQEMQTHFMFLGTTSGYKELKYINRISPDYYKA